jgi:hypothetical protein
MNFAPLLEVTLWSTLSSFVQVTFCPTRTVEEAGWKRSPFIEIAPGAAAGGEPAAVLDDDFFDDDEPPQPAAPRASATNPIKPTRSIAHFTLKETLALAPAFEWSLFASCTCRVCLPLGMPLYLIVGVTDGEYLPVTPSFFASAPFAPEYFG